jgi:hypothetical protein
MPENRCANRDIRWVNIDDPTILFPNPAMSRRTLVLTGMALCLTLIFMFTGRDRPTESAALPDPTAPDLSEVDDSRMNLPSAEEPPTLSSMDGVSEAGQVRDGVHRVIAGTGEYISWSSRTPASKRTEVVQVNRSLLTPDPVLQVGNQLVVDLHGKDSIVATVSDVQIWGNGTVAVSGRLPDNPHSRIFLSYTDGRASMLIQDRAAGTRYKVEYAHDLGAYVALEVDHEASDILECGDCGLVHDSSVHAPRETGTGTSYSQLEDASFPETVSLDVLVVYTAAARTDEGSTVDMENAISQAFLLANDTHSNSDTRISLNIAHTEEVTYVEENPEDSGSPGRYLDDVTNGVGDLSGVPTLRNTHSADFVVFVVDTEKTGGLAWLSLDYDREDIAFCIVRVKQLDSSYTLVHEIAHNMGMGHSATQTNQPFTGGIYPYAAGWQWADGTSSASVGFCTVMTYENFDGVPGDEYERVPHFSNPDVLYNGIATGSSGTADGARVMRNGRFDYSAFRGPKAIPSTAVTDFPDTLDFEEYFGIWYQPDTDELDWERNGAGTPSGSTGPTAPYAGSFYAYVETSFVNPGDEALLTAILDLTGLINTEIDFVYHMYGDTMGALYLEVSTDGGNNWSSLWDRSGDQGNAWYTQNVDLSAHDGDLIHLRFRGVRGSDFRSDIALDDISISASLAVPTFTTFVDANYPALSDKTPGGDPDLDGVINFLEYAFGMLLDTPDAASAPANSYDDVADELSISFVRAQEGVRYVVQSTDDLDFAGSAAIEWDSDLNPANLVPVGNMQTVDVAMPGGGKLFLQVEATE